jgi:hypothetical protein
LLEETLFGVFFGAVSIATVLTLVVLLLKEKFGWAKRFYGIEKMRRSRERFAANR